MSGFVLDAASTIATMAINATIGKCVWCVAAGERSMLRFIEAERTSDGKGRSEANVHGRWDMPRSQRRREAL